MFSLEQYPLNFAPNALEPHMSAATINFHHGKHLDTYIKNLNGLIAGTDYEKLSLQEIIVKSASDTNAKKVFNNAAQVFNHGFFFQSMALNNGSTFPENIAKAFGSREKFMEEFKTVALGIFGSGWAWLVNDKGSLKIMGFSNADTPIAHGLKPVLSLDVWEHSYYLDYQNRRGDFIDAFLNNLVDWNFVNNNL
ncbi:MAG: superoxide dismutase [Alphaproteobacteria bacterium]|nr:superoxide dismutase [Alphaproteobacteria bacterium]MBN2675457.1 superoxide dismutase [Alphaproteobacteria bacterium]